MSELQLGKFKRNSVNVDTNEIKGGIKREALQTDAERAIFDAIDGKTGAKDGILDANEVAEFIRLLNEAAGNEKLTKREAGRLLKDLGLKELDKKELFNFVNVIYGDSQDVSSSTVNEENGDIVINYNDGLQETIHTDMSFDTRIEDKNGTVTVKEFSSERLIERETVTDSNNNVQVTDFNEDQLPTLTTTTYQNEDTYEVYYCNGVPETGILTEHTEDNGIVVSNYIFDDNNEEILTRRVSNKGTELELVSEFEHMDNGVVKEVFRGNNVEGTRYTYNGLVCNEIINENDGQRVISREYDVERNCSETICENNNVTQTITNADGYRLMQTKVIDGRQYTVVYDANGNTKGIVVQFNESIQAVANKFGCTVEELIAANPDAVKGSGRNKYFQVGAEIVIPKEIDADLALKDRDTREQAIARYENYQAEQERIRILRDECNVIDFEGAGDVVSYGGVNYTVLGTRSNRGRKLLADESGQPAAILDGDKVYVFNPENPTKAEQQFWYTEQYDDVVNDPSKSDMIRMIDLGNGRQAKCVVLNNSKREDGKRDALGREYIVDRNGNVFVTTCAMDPEGLGHCYPENSQYLKVDDMYRAGGHSRATVSDGDVRYIKDGNGKVWYYKYNKLVTGDHRASFVNEEAEALYEQIYTKASDEAWGTDEELLMDGVRKIYSSEVLDVLNQKLSRADSDYNINGTALEGLILDEETHSNARPYFRTLIDNQVMSDRQVGTMLAREIDWELNGGFGITFQSDLHEVANLAQTRGQRLAAEEAMHEINPNIEADHGSYIRGAIRADGWTERETNMVEARYAQTFDVKNEAELAHLQYLGDSLVFEADTDDEQSIESGMMVMGSSDEMYEYFLERAAQVNASREYSQTITGQDAGQVFLSNISKDGDNEVDVELVVDYNNTLFRYGVPAKQQAEMLLLEAKQDPDALVKLFATNNPDVFDNVENILANENIQNCSNITELYNKAYGTASGYDKYMVKAGAIISGKVEFSEEDIENFCISMMHEIDDAVGKGVSSGYSAGNINTSEFLTEQLKVILRNHPGLATKLRPRVEAGKFEVNVTTTFSDGTHNVSTTSTVDAKGDFLEMLSNTKQIVDETVFYDPDGNLITDSEIIAELTEANMEALNGFRELVATLKRDHVSGLGDEGCLSDAANFLAEYSGWGTDRDDVSTVYYAAEALLQELEAAAQGRLRDADGNVISVQDLAQRMIDAESSLSEANASYQSTIGTWKMGIVLAPVIAVTTVVTMGTGSLAWGAVGATAATAVPGATEIWTSTTGNSAEAWERVAKESIVAGVSTFGGGKIGQYAMNLNTSNFIRYGTMVIGDAGLTAGGEYFTTGTVTAEGMAFGMAFSLVGNGMAVFGGKGAKVGARNAANADVTPVVSAEVRHSANSLDDFLRTTTNNGTIARQGSVGKLGPQKFADYLDAVKKAVPLIEDDVALAELRARALSLSDPSQQRAFLHAIDDEFYIRRIQAETNLGDLHNLEAEVRGWSNSQANAGRRQTEILEAIANRRATLQTEGGYTINHAPVDPQVKTAAMEALNSGVALTPNARNAIKQYIASISDPNELFVVVAQLKTKSNIGPKIKNAIAAKAAELNVPNPLKTDVTPVVRVEEAETPVIRAEEPETPVAKPPVEDELLVGIERLNSTEVKAKLIEGGVDAKAIHNNVFQDQGSISYTKDGVKYRIHYEDGKPTAIRTVDAEGNKSYYSVDADGVKTPIDREAFLQLQKSSNAKFNQAINGDLDAQVHAVDADIPANVKSTWEDVKSKITSLKESFTNGVHVSVERLNGVLSDLRALGTKVSSAVKARLSKLANDLKALFRTQTPEAANPARLADDVEPAILVRVNADDVDPVVRPVDADVELVEVVEVGVIGAAPKHKPSAAAFERIQSFNTKHIVEVGEVVPDGYRDAGRSIKFAEDGSIINPEKIYRETIVVDRTQDTKLVSMIEDVKLKTANMTEAEKAVFLHEYIYKLTGDGTTACDNLKAWEPQFVGREVLIGDIVTNNPPIAVCRHRSLLYKVLGDEIGLDVELQRGNFYYDNGYGGGHAWNTVRFKDGTSAIYDVMHNRVSSTTPGGVDSYAHNYYDVKKNPLYSNGLEPIALVDDEIQVAVFVDTPTPMNKGVQYACDTNAKLTFTDDFDVDLSRYSSKIGAMKDGDVLVIGTARDCDIQLPPSCNGVVAGRHIKISKVGDDIIVTNLTDRAVTISPKTVASANNVVRTPIENRIRTGRPIRMIDDNFDFNNPIYHDTHVFAQHLHAKIETQIGVLKPDEISAMARNLSEKLDVPETEVLEVMHRLTQFASNKQFDSLGAEFQKLGISHFYNSRISTNNSLEYLAFEKKQIPLKQISSGDKVVKGFVLDDAGLRYLEGLSPEQKVAFVNEVKNGDVVLVNLDGTGLKIGDNYYSYTFTDGGQNLEAMAEAVILQTNSGRSLDDVINGDFSTRLNQVLGEDLSTHIHDIKLTGNNISATTIANQVNPHMPTVTQIEATINTAIDANPDFKASMPEDQLLGKSVLAKYYDYMMRAYSNDGMMNLLQTKHNDIMAQVSAMGKSADDVVFVYMRDISGFDSKTGAPIPGGPKSFELICHQYAKANGIDVSQMIEYNGKTPLPMGDGKVVVLIDDVVGSGNSMVYERFNYDDFKANNPNSYVIFSPIQCASNGEKKILDAIAAHGNVDALLFDKSNLSNYDKFMNSLTPEEQMIFGKFGTNLGYKDSGMCTVFPYMIPDNNTQLSGLLLRKFLNNDLKWNANKSNSWGYLENNGVNIYDEIERTLSSY